MTKKTPKELMNPSKEELERGDEAIRDLVAHMKRMGSAGTTRHIPDGSGEWVITIEWKSNGKVN